MIKKTAVYTDFNGNERTEDCYFHFSEPEILDLETSEEGGFFTKTVNDIINAKDGLRLSVLMKDLMLKAYGVKSPDGKRFIKSEEISKEFSTLFMELITNDKSAADFVNLLVPKSFVKIVKEKNAASLPDTAN